jgi:hypothetical protein
VPTPFQITRKRSKQNVEVVGVAPPCLPRYLRQPRGFGQPRGFAPTTYLGQPRGVCPYNVFGATTGGLPLQRIWGIVAYKLIIICSINVEIDSCKYLCHIISIGINHQIHEYLAQLCPDADI